MSKVWYISFLAFLALTLNCGVSLAQSAKPRDAWLMQNYRFTGPPPPGSIVPADPVVSQLREIQNVLLSILRKADFADDWEAALAAGEQAAAITQLIGTITKRLESASAVTEEQARLAASAPVYSIAFKDHTIEAATSYWADGRMLHYLTPQGSHVQVRVDLLDLNLTTRINRAKNLDFNLP